MENNHLTKFYNFYNSLLDNQIQTNENNENLHIFFNLLYDKIVNKYLGYELDNTLYLYLLNKRIYTKTIMKNYKHFLNIVPAEIIFQLINNSNNIDINKIKEIFYNIEDITKEINETKFTTMLEVGRLKNYNITEFPINLKLLNFDLLKEKPNVYNKYLYLHLLSIFKATNGKTGNFIFKNINKYFNQSLQLKNILEENINLNYEEVIFNKNIHFIILEELTGINTYYWYIFIYLILLKYKLELEKQGKKTIDIVKNVGELYIYIVNLLINYLCNIKETKKRKIKTNKDIFNINFIKVTELILKNKNYKKIQNKPEGKIYKVTRDKILKEYNEIKETIIYAETLEEYIFKFYLSEIILYINKNDEYILYRDLFPSLREVQELDKEEVIFFLTFLYVKETEDFSVTEKLSSFKIKEHIYINKTYDYFYINNKNKSEILYIFNLLKEALQLSNKDTNININKELYAFLKKIEG